MADPGLNLDFVYINFIQLAYNLAKFYFCVFKLQVIFYTYYLLCVYIKGVIWERKL